MKTRMSECDGKAIDDWVAFVESKGGRSEAQWRHIFSFGIKRCGFSLRLYQSWRYLDSEKKQIGKNLGVSDNTHNPGCKRRRE